MSQIDVTTLRKLIEEAITQWVAGTSPDDSPDTSVKDVSTVTFSEPSKPRTDGKRAVRTKSTGDRVYLIDDNAKTKAWITSPEIMTKLGFEMSDVQDLEDSALVSYQMAPSIYRVDE